MNIHRTLKNLFSKKNVTDTRTDESFIFRTGYDISHEDSRSAGKEERAIALFCFRTLVVNRFSLPFGKNGRIGDALRMSYRHLLGDSGSVVMIHRITEQSDDRTEGVAWFISKDEVEEAGRAAGKGTMLWPAPLAAASRVEGNGPAIWHSDNGTAGILFREWVPVVYRWTPSSETSADELEKWFREYCRSQNIDPGLPCIIGPLLSQSEIQKMGSETLRSLKASASFDLSAESADSTRRLESFFSSAFYVAGSALLLGSFFLILSAAMFFYSTFKTDTVRTLPSSIYHAAFGERSANPLSSAAAKLRMSAPDTAGITLERTLENLAAAWDPSAPPDRIKLDSIRYGSERTEIQGTAADTAAVESLRDSLNRNGFTPRISNIHQISGSRARFTINLESEEVRAVK